MTDPTDPTNLVGPAPPDPAELEHLLRLAEAMAFASPTPLTARALGHVLPEGSDADSVLAALAARYAGRGVELVQAAGGWQFRTAPDLAARLRRVVQVPRRLPRVAMETLAIVAYHQPVTRPEIEEIRGAALSQATMDQLLETGLIQPRGRKETPGRPTMWGTTPAFLAQFGLADLRDLPRREDLFVEAPSQPSYAKPEQSEPEPSSPEQSVSEPASGDGSAVETGPRPEDEPA
jgi:segregation and condensation protein B